MSDEQANQTLAALLRQWHPKQSWSNVRRWVENRRVEVDGNVSLEPDRRLKKGMVVRVHDHPIAAPSTQDDVIVRYLDQHLVVVEKPAMMTTIRHPEEMHWPKKRRQMQPTLDELLPGIVADLDPRSNRPSPSPKANRPAKGGKQPDAEPIKRGPPLKLRAVHRLDRETSGLMVFARTVPAESHLGQQFRFHTIDRQYVALVYGKAISQTIDSHLVDDRGDGRRGSTTLPNVGKHAVTHIELVEAFASTSLVRCQLETGRTHQIRIHLAEAGHVLLGEKVYNRKLFGPEMPDTMRAPRVMLHAQTLAFTHPISEERLSFSCDPPEDFEVMLKKCRYERR